MPKKLTTNTKAVEARERKAAVKKQKATEEERRKEDAKWVDDDKSLAKKQERKVEEEKKKAELLKKKAEAKALLEEEEKSLKITAKIPLAKITRAQIEQEQEKRNKNIEKIYSQNKPSTASIVTPKEIPIEENLNRMMADVHVASNVDEALKVLKTDATDEDRHPEKRMKAAYKAYEEAEMPILKAENPSLKLSQLKQIIFKNWQKAPENPLNKGV